MPKIIRLNHSRKVGFSFGLTTGVITTLGMMVGLNASTHSVLAVLGGIIAIAIADAFSDALGIHISEETEGVHSQREVWESTLSTFVTKFVVAFTFIVPVLLLPLNAAIVTAIIWGMLLVSVFSVHIARTQGKSVPKTVMEHLAFAVVVIIVTHYVGGYVGAVFV